MNTPILMIEGNIPQDIAPTDIYNFLKKYVKIDFLVEINRDIERKNSFPINVTVYNNNIPDKTLRFIEGLLIGYYSSQDEIEQMPSIIQGLILGHEEKINKTESE